MRHLQIIAGEQVYLAMQAEIKMNVPKSTRPGCEHLYASGPLCAHQQRMHQKGYTGAHIIKSIYGFTLRYDSGLNNFGIIAGVRDGRLNGSFDDAVRYAKEWQALAPDRRYVTYSGE